LVSLSWVIIIQKKLSHQSTPLTIINQLRYDQWFKSSDTPHVWHVQPPNMGFPRIPIKLTVFYRPFFSHPSNGELTCQRSCSRWLPASWAVYLY
jgi:hypothetical protein